MADEHSKEYRRHYTSQSDSLTFKKSKEKEKPKDSLTKEVEKPWPDDKRDPKNQQKLTVDENHGEATISSSGLPSVNPTPSSSFSTKGNSAAAQRTTFSSNFVGFVPPSVEAFIYIDYACPGEINRPVSHSGDSCRMSVSA
ncbi:hypothetical protein OS493_029990 [Desmophyllum pertusum]|uniref:Uncharacterized protein n=1 Tax=Desmophyllum pertusum TaxID=174260 RepID=A0A9W9ZYY8_9CNID|nr:hypothetical protein OS493_029990 [Desmophyllum pertusum]